VNSAVIETPTREELEAALARAEERARVAEARLDHLQALRAELGHVRFRLTVPEGRVVEISSASERLFGVPAERVLSGSHHVRELLRFTDDAQFDGFWYGLCEGLAPRSFEHGFTLESGEDRWILLANWPVRDASGALVALECLARDVTAARRATAALFEEKEQLLTTLESIADGVIATDAAGCVTLMNPEAERLTGWSWDEAQGLALHEVYQVVTELGHEQRQDLVQQVIESGEVVNPFGGAVLLRPDGGERLLDELAAPIRDSEDQIVGVVLVFRDQTAQRRVEEQTLRSQKLEALGVLAGGIAHDFNNILTGVMGNVSLALRQLPEGEPTAEWLGEAERALERARGLTQQLLTFARGGSPILRAMPVEELVRDSVSFALAGSDVGCQIDLDADLWPVEVDEAQISRVFQNLVLNAEEAMPDGGTIRVRVSNRTMGPGNDHSLLEGRYVRISVEDHGVGMEASLLPRIFEPYFTTKDHGSGLGLSVCYSIVNRHRGALVVESEPDLGTTFFVYLPAASEDVEEISEHHQVALPGTGRVLIMDDEAMVRDVASAMLRYLGYEPVSVSDGAAAVDLYSREAEAGRPFDVVLMDLTIPGGMGGQEAVKWLLSMDPDARCIVSSGYSDDPVMADHRAWGFRGVMHKPYRLDDLARALQAVLMDPLEPLVGGLEE
jgi:two-component system cell cycle sensor histidine kinase/response regulator CckA